MKTINLKIKNLTSVQNIPVTVEQSTIQGDFTFELFGRPHTFVFTIETEPYPVMYADIYDGIVEPHTKDNGGDLMYREDEFEYTIQ